MEQTIHTPETYDFRKYDQIWRRVAPNLEPYRGLPSRRPVRTWSTCPVRRRTPAAWAPWRRRNWE